MGGCAVQRHAYTTASPARIYEEDYMTSRRLPDIPVGDTVFVATQDQVGSLYLIPVTYKGYRVYAYAPELLYLGQQAAPKQKGRTRTLPDYQTPQANAQDLKREYRSYPGGMVFISVKDSVSSQGMSEKVLTGKAPKSTGRHATAAKE